MSDQYADLLGSLDGSGESYPPFDKIVPQPKFLVINLYCGYTLVGDKMICITNAEQTPYAEQLQIALAQIGFNWNIRIHTPDDGRKDVAVQFEIKPLKHGSGAYEIEVENYNPGDKYFGDGIITLTAHDLAGIGKGTQTLIQTILLGYEAFSEDIASLWIKDWEDPE